MNNCHLNVNFAIVFFFGDFCSWTKYIYISLVSGRLMKWHLELWAPHNHLEILCDIIFSSKHIAPLFIPSQKLPCSFSCYYCCCCYFFSSHTHTRTHTIHSNSLMYARKQCVNSLFIVSSSFRFGKCSLRVEWRKKKRKQMDSIDSNIYQHI